MPPYRQNPQSSIWHPPYPPTLKRILQNQIPIGYDDENYEYDDENGDNYDGHDDMRR